MRMISAAIRGSRPTTRFTIPTGLNRQRELGLHRAAPAIRPAAPVELVTRSPLVALRGAVHGVGRAVPGHRRGGQMADTRIRLKRSDAVRWSGKGGGAAHQTRPRSPAPWRG